MSKCAAEVAGNCLGTTFDGRRGICSNCYKWLVEIGELNRGDKFDDYPKWLKEFVRERDRIDREKARHPTQQYDDENTNRGTRTSLGAIGCYKYKKLTGSQ